MTISFKNILILAALASGAMLAGALTAQYGFGLHPCELCIKQRLPYLAIILIALPSAFWVKNDLWKRRIVYLCAALFLLDSGIAFYHAGVEAGWFPAPSSCSNKTGGGNSIEELRRQIMEAPLVACNQAMAHILGLSLAAWNAIAAFVLTLATLLACRKAKT